MIIGSQKVTMVDGIMKINITGVYGGSILFGCIWTTICYLRQQNYDGQYGPQRNPYDETYRNNPYDNYYDNYDQYNKPVVEKYYTFQEEFPSWMPQNQYWDPVPSLKFVGASFLFSFWFALD